MEETNAVVGRKSRSEVARERWQRLVDEQVASGQTVRAFCRDRGVCEHSFYVSRKKLRDGSAPSRSRSRRRKTFLPVRVSPSSTSAIEVRFPSGHILRASRNVDVATLARCIALLDKK